MTWSLRTLSCLLLFVGALTPQQPGGPPPVDSSGQTIKLQQAKERARQYGAQLESANIAALLAKQDRVQAKAAALPSLSVLNQYIYTEGNGTPSGVFVANDGVHVYNEQAVLHQELFSILRRGEIKAAAAAEAVARAKADVAGRGLDATVIQDYYGIVSAERKLKNAQTSLSEAQHFLDITQKQEKGGEAAHVDVVKAQLQIRQRERDVGEAQLAIEKAKLTLAVLIFPTLPATYDVEDDLSTLQILPPMPEAAARANTNNPDVTAAQAGLTEAGLAVTVARYGYLPSFSLDFFYGIDANQYAFTSHNAAAEERSNLPNFDVTRRRNLGYSGQLTLNIPIWNWGATHSKVTQAAIKRHMAEIDLAATRKQLQAGVARAYQEAQTALSQVESLRESSGLSADNLRLTILRYQAGEATAFEVVDAQTVAIQARAGYDDGLLRYRVALADLQTLTGGF